MRLVETVLQNYRGYRDPTTISIDDLTVLVGKNDAGKSTVLEALNCVLSGGKVDDSDVSVACAPGDSMFIECVFDDVGDLVLTLDTSSQTTLASEYLLDLHGRLRVRWQWQVSGDPGALTLGTASLRVIANHPTADSVMDLHSKTNGQLKTAVRSAGIEDECNQSNNADMRAALWRQVERGPGLSLAMTELELAKQDGKEIATQIKNQLPTFVLFRSDRPSTDQDGEVQNPMKAAVKLAVDELRPKFEGLMEEVRRRVMDVGRRTIESLADLDPGLADDIIPVFSSEPNWAGQFKFTLQDDTGVSLNKRGSGVRRLVLISFFRAEAESQRSGSGGRSIIYAVEEPETAQHPDNQKKLMAALRDLAERDGCQVLLTTHLPAMAELVPVESLRFVSKVARGTLIEQGSNEQVLVKIIESLGVHTERNVRLLICVEGPTDVEVLTNFASLYREADTTMPDLASDPRVALIPLGGGTLEHFVQKRYLERTRAPEYHIYDRDEMRGDGRFKYQDAVDAVNRRGAGHSARLTKKREIENYIHPAAVRREFERVTGQETAVDFGDDDDVVATLTSSLLDANGSQRRRIQRLTWKRWLSSVVAPAMTLEELRERDAAGEVVGWLREIGGLLEYPIIGEMTRSLA